MPEKHRFLTWPKLIIALLICGLALMGFWIYMRDAIVRGVSDTINTLEDEGYKIGHGGLMVDGFPLSLRAKSKDVIITAPKSKLPDPSKNWSLKADQLQLKTATLTPLSWEIFHTGKLRIDMRGQQGERYMFDISPANITAHIAASVKGQIKKADLKMGPAQLDSLVGTPPIIYKIDATQARLTTSGQVGNFDMAVQGVLLSPATKGLLDNILGRRISQAHLSARIDNFQLLETQGLWAWQQNGHITSDDWQILWGLADMMGDFDITFKDGVPSGSIKIRLKNAEKLVEKIGVLGLLDAKQSKQMHGFLSVLKTNADGRKEIELTLQNGDLLYGFTPLYHFE